MIFIVISLILSIPCAVFSLFMIVKDFASMGKNGKDIGFSIWILPVMLSLSAFTICIFLIFLG